jgi:radical SAM protein with 4Fe4S-binding SPASM domain
MREIRYKDFSFRRHQKNWRKDRPNSCQFELTFGCLLHCRHCYTDCYNNPKDLKKELTTDQIISILDKVYDSGVLWLCFTGGDPFARKDFLKIYAYAKKKGFIVTIFSSGAFITQEIVDYFKKLKPFCVELTLNGVTQRTYEAISGVKASFAKAMTAIESLKAATIPFKIKTQVTKQNIRELDKMRAFVEDLGLEFRPSTMLFARLNRDPTPCRLRIEPEEVLAVDGRFQISSMDEEGLSGRNHKSKAKANLFNCGTGIDTFHINPYGDMLLCSTVREPSVNLLKNEVADGLKLFKKIIRQRFKTESKCQACSIRHLCYSCPGRAYLETGNPEAQVEYFCKLAHLIGYGRS